MNFAHSDFVAFAAYIALFANTSGRHLASAFLVAILATIVLGVFIEKVVRLPMRWKNISRTTLIIISISTESEILTAYSRRDYYRDVAGTLLLDEPSAGLAPVMRDMVFEKIAEVNRAGTSILIVEQNARRSLGISDRGYMLEMCRNRFEWRGLELLENEDVLRYLGG